MGNLNILDSDRLDVLDRAIRNVLGTEVALETYAQIIDGLPLADVANNQWMGPYGGFVPDHPINRHTSLCPGVLERTEQYRSEFGIHTLEFDENEVNAFQSAPFGERHFQLRLIELVTLAVHQMAAQLFNKNLRIHDKHLGPSGDSIDAVISWAGQNRVRVSRIFNAETNFFTHPSYNNMSSYPKRAADVVGYWAQGRILGGVVSFATSEDPEPNPSLCSDRKGYPDRGMTWQLFDSQQQELVDFLLSATALPGSECPLPLRCLNEKQVAPLPSPRTYTGTVTSMITSIRRGPAIPNQLGPIQAVLRSESSKRGKLEHFGSPSRKRPTISIRKQLGGEEEKREKNQD